MDMAGSSASLGSSASIEISRANQLEELKLRALGLPRGRRGPQPAGRLTWPPGVHSPRAAAAGDGSQGNLEPGQAHLL